MEKTILEEMREGGSKIPDMVKYLIANGWKNYNHHDNWVKEGVVGEYDTHEAYQIQCGNRKLKRAVEILIEALREDEGYYDSWKSNIAMSMYDEILNNAPKDKDEDSGEALYIMTRTQVAKMGNKAGDRFLQLLISKPTIE